MIVATYNYLLVGISVLVAMMSAFTGLSLTRNLSAQPLGQRQVRIIIAAIVVLLTAFVISCALLLTGASFMTRAWGGADIPDVAGRPTQPLVSQPISAREFYHGRCDTARADDEILVAVDMARPVGGHAYEKQKCKIGDYATAVPLYKSAVPGPVLARPRSR